MAPEIHLRKPYKGDQVDVFSCGVILFMMVTQTQPFNKAHPKNDQLFKALCLKPDAFWQCHCQQKGPDFFSTEFKDFIQQILKLKSEERLSIDQIRAHPWM